MVKQINFVKSKKKLRDFTSVLKKHNYKFSSQKVKGIKNKYLIVVKGKRK